MNASNKSLLNQFDVNDRLNPGSLIQLKIPDLCSLPKRRDKRESRFVVRTNVPLANYRANYRGLRDGDFGNRDGLARDGQSFWWPVK